MEERLIVARTQWLEEAAAHNQEGLAKLREDITSKTSDRIDECDRSLRDELRVPSMAYAKINAVEALEVKQQAMAMALEQHATMVRVRLCLCVFPPLSSWFVCAIVKGA